MSATLRPDEAREALARHTARLRAFVEASTRIHIGPSAEEVVRAVAVEALALFQAREARVVVDAAPGREALSHAETDPTASGGVDDVVVEPLSDLKRRPIGSLTITGAALCDTDLLLLAQVGRAAVAALEAAWLLGAATEASRARDEVLAVVSHDLRSPLSTVSMGASMLRRSLSASGAERASDLDLVLRIERACKSMNRLIEDLLDASRLDGGTFVVVPRATAAGDLVHEAVEAAAVAASSRRVSVSVGEVERFRVMADRSRVLQLFSNLVGNAMKFTPPGGEVVVSAERVGESGRFTVRDDGRGIPREHLPRLFDRYWKGGGDNPGGHGLGLYIARGIVEAHRGRIEVQSEVGRGTSFAITLPLAP